jgi:excisionase family DNA binding protein
MNMTDNRVDASLLTDEERKSLPRLLDLTQQNRLPLLKGVDGAEIPLPEVLSQLLVKVMQSLRNGQAMLLVPEDETFTTQAGADFLGMSRQHFVGLLESEQIPFHRVGTHRRVRFKDLRDYVQKRDQDRRVAMDQLFQKVRKAGLYDASYTGDAS